MAAGAAQVRRKIGFERRDVVPLVSQAHDGVGRRGDGIRRGAGESLPQDGHDFLSIDHVSAADARHPSARLAPPEGRAAVMSKGGPKDKPGARRWIHGLPAPIRQVANAGGGLPANAQLLRKRSATRLAPTN